MICGKCCNRGKQVVTFQPANRVSTFKIEYKDQTFTFKSAQFSKLTFLNENVINLKQALENQKI